LWYLGAVWVIVTNELRDQCVLASPRFGVFVSVCVVVGYRHCSARGLRSGLVEKGGDFFCYLFFRKEK
jgi:hypothetical protein